MDKIPKEQVHRRLQLENPWWASPDRGTYPYSGMKPRAYFTLLLPLLRQVNIRRAILLMGPRRVGKTVLIHHAIQDLIRSGTNPKHICYVSVDHPIYNGCGLEDLLGDYRAASDTADDKSQRYVFFDEIQYLRDWEIHLKALVDASPGIKIVASGSAAAALRLKSHESGAGRFTEFLLPPLTFHEYLDLLGRLDLIVPGTSDDNKHSAFWAARDIEELNKAFVHYLNFGGYPEVIFSEQIQADPGRFIKSDIIDKVLLRDLPSLYGIQDIQELNHLFTTLAYNTAQEISLEVLSQSSGVAKNTIKRYIEYLEAAFLIKVVHRIDRNSKRFLRANFFKVYLTNPSIRAALFTPVGADDPAMGALAETGIFSQWFHSQSHNYYSRWNNGEVDMVSLAANQKPSWAVEVKWSDRYVENPYELKSLLQFCRANKLKEVTVTSRRISTANRIDGLEIQYIPASIYCYTVGFNLIRGKNVMPTMESALDVATQEITDDPVT